MTASKERIIEISETIRDHLIKQNAQAKNEGDCQYMAADGKMCAVGCLLKPEHYNPEFEGCGIDHVGLAHAVSDSLGVELSLMGDDPLHELLSEWQGYHDWEYAEHLNGAANSQSPAEIHDKLIGELSEWRGFRDELVGEPQ